MNEFYDEGCDPRDIHRRQQAMQHMMLIQTDFFEHFVIKFFTQRGEWGLVRGSECEFWWFLHKWIDTITVFLAGESIPGGWRIQQFGHNDCVIYGLNRVAVKSMCSQHSQSVEQLRTWSDGSPDMVRHGSNKDIWSKRNLYIICNVKVSSGRMCRVSLYWFYRNAALVLLPGETASSLLRGPRWMHRWGHHSHLLEAPSTLSSLPLIDGVCAAKACPEGIVKPIPIHLLCSASADQGIDNSSWPSFLVGYMIQTRSTCWFHCVRCHGSRSYWNLSLDLKGWPWKSRSELLIVTPCSSWVLYVIKTMSIWTYHIRCLESQYDWHMSTDLHSWPWKSRSNILSNDLHYLWLNTWYRLDFSIDFNKIEVKELNKIM